MRRFIGDWMENEFIIPTDEEAIDLYLVVESTPYEFDYTCEDVLKKAEIRGLNRMYIETMVIIEQVEK